MVEVLFGVRELEVPLHRIVVLFRQLMRWDSPGCCRKCPLQVAYRVSITRPWWSLVLERSCPLTREVREPQ
jgi:hypothetical protein